MMIYMKNYDYVINVGMDFDHLEPDAAYRTKDEAVDAAIMHASSTGEVAEVVYSPADDLDYPDYIVFRTNGEIGTFYDKDGNEI